MSRWLSFSLRSFMITGKYWGRKTILWFWTAYWYFRVWFWTYSRHLSRTPPFCPIRGHRAVTSYHQPMATEKPDLLKNFWWVKNTCYFNNDEVKLVFFSILIIATTEMYTTLDIVGSDADKLKKKLWLHFCAY